MPHILRHVIETFGLTFITSRDAVSEQNIRSSATTGTTMKYYLLNIMLCIQLSKNTQPGY